MPPDALPWNVEHIVRAMANGIDKPLQYPTRAGRKVIPAGTPLTARQAAMACGCRVKRLERVAQTQEFQELLRANQLLEAPLSMAVAIAIRDDPESDGPARLAAIETIRNLGRPVEARLPIRTPFKGRLRIRRKLLGAG